MRIRIDHGLHTVCLCSFTRCYNFFKGRSEHSDLESHWYGGLLNITLIILFFSHVMLVVIMSKKARKHMYPNLLQIYDLPLLPHGPQISYLFLEDIFEDSPDYDSDNAPNEDFQCNTDAPGLSVYVPQLIQ